MATEVVARSASHFLIRDDDGWELWSVDQDSDAPLLQFPGDEAGEERARTAFAMRSRETRRVHVLAIVALTTGSLWAVLEVVAFLLREGLARDELQSFAFEAEVQPTILVALAWISAGGAVARVFFEVVVGLFVVMWLQRRWRREG